MSVMANSERREVVSQSRSLVEEAVRKMLLTYNRRYVIPSAH
jgi:hypothetical protein